MLQKGANDGPSAHGGAVCELHLLRKIRTHADWKRLGSLLEAARRARRTGASEAKFEIPLKE